MTKTTATTIITVCLLLLGGGSLHLLHKDNQEATARVEPLQARKNATAGAGPPQASKETIPDSTAEDRALGTPTPATTASPASPENTAYLDRLGEGMRSVNMGGAMLTTMNNDVVNEMDEMQLETLVQLLIEAQTDDDFTKLRSLILDKIAAQSPAEATMHAAEMVINASPFNEALSSKFGGYFRKWLETDRAAADRWYFAAMASGELIPKNIPEAGREIRMPDRTIMLHRFNVMLNAGSEQAISMAEEMTDEEIVDAMYSMSQSYRNANTSPGFISRIVRQLPPERQNEALGGYVDFMARREFARASAWLDAVDIAETAHVTLLSRALSVAYNYNRLSQSEAFEILDSWPESREREKARRWINRN